MHWMFASIFILFSTLFLHAENPSPLPLFDDLMNRTKKVYPSHNQEELSTDTSSSEELPDEGHVINFSKVSALELVKFVSKIAKVNFIFKEDLLDFDVSFISNKPTSAKKVLGAVVSILEAHALKITQSSDDYFIIDKAPAPKENQKESETNTQEKSKEDPIKEPPPIIENQEVATEEGRFFVYKLQYHKGSEIENALKQVASDIVASNGSSFDFIHTINSMQWMPSTNSLLFSGSDHSIQKVRELVKNLDAPLKQVFIEILVIETDMRNSLDFGLEWSLSGKYKDKLGIGGGAFPPNHRGTPFASTMQGIDASNPPAGASQIPIGSGFDLGIIGDIIFHKGRSFLSLGSLVSALQVDGDTTIVLNQKIITQDNKKSTIFVGDNIPFPGAVVQTIGSSQQTTANIEYRDVGVNLNITPMLGENNIITLEISEEITEAIEQRNVAAGHAGGIQTTKTNMLTSAHVPNQSFLVLSGMTKTKKRSNKSGIPCLGGLPMIGKIFSKEEKGDEKRNILIFVKPQIINSVDDYQKVSQNVTPEDLKSLINS